MKLKIDIISGKRKGDFMYLNKISSPSFSSLYILEDESLEFTFTSELYYSNILLILHESEIQVNSIFENDAGWVYRWLPKKIGMYTYESFFHNYYGLAEFSIEVELNDETEVYYFESIEILAKKINAQNVECMLDFLVKNSSDSLYDFFRVTRKNSGFSSGDTPAEIIMEHLEHTTNNIFDIIKKIAFKPITKLTNKEECVYFAQNINVDDVTLSWLSENTDVLFETDCLDEAILELNNKLYSSKIIVDNKLIEDTNVYENQVLHGFILNLIGATLELINGLDCSIENNTMKNNNIEGYFSLFNHIGLYHKNINKRKLQRCRGVLNKLYSLKKLLENEIKTSKAIFGIPTFTMKVKKNPLYLSIFNKIVNWYSYGKPDWSLQNELISIKSIPKLFEYYTLFYIKEILDLQLKKTSRVEVDEHNTCFTYLLKDNITITLLYEPKFWTVNHINNNSGRLINTEAWTVYGRKIIPRSSTHKHSNRTPDYVLKMDINGAFQEYYIIDAKYTFSDKAYISYLPELVMKYLHGLYPVNIPNSIISGLLIVNPDNESSVKHFHHENFNMFSQEPIRPYLTCAAITPGKEFVTNIDFEKIIIRVLELFIDSCNLKDKPLSINWKV